MTLVVVHVCIFFCFCSGACRFCWIARFLFCCCEFARTKKKKFHVFLLLHLGGMYKCVCLQEGAITLHYTTLYNTTHYTLHYYTTIHYTSHTYYTQHTTHNTQHTTQHTTLHNIDKLIQNPSYLQLSAAPLRLCMPRPVPTSALARTPRSSAKAWLASR